MNYLKETNDRYGHDAGNKLIVSAAQIISGVFQRSPVFRIGGDEFCVILQNKDLADVKMLFERFDSECATSYVNIGDGNTKFPISIAKGFAQFDPAKDTQFSDVFERADTEMYKNKRLMKEADN